MQLNDWLRHLRQAARALSRSPAFVATSVGMLGLAIGATAGLFSVVDKVLLDPLPYREPERLVDIVLTAPGSDMPEEFGVSREFLLQYREQAKSLADVGSYNSFTNTLRSADRVERVRMTWPSNSLFSTLGVQPILGRLPIDSDERNAVVISHALWVSWFNSDPAVIGRTITAAEGERTVIGVMGPDFKFPTNDTMLWLSNPLRVGDIETTGDFGMALVGRMAPGATTESLANELTAVARRLPERFGGTPAYARIIEQHHAIVRPVTTRFLGNVAQPLWILLGSALLVLLIACANVANLFLVRTEARHREFAMRRALGAARRQLITVQMAEALIIAGLAGVVAIALAAAFVPLLLQFAPPGIPRVDEVTIGPATWGFTLALALLSALICGGVPAWRGSAPDLTRLREAGRGSTSTQHWVRNTLVVGQTALALVLLIASGLLMRSAQKLLQVDPGYDPRDVFTFQIAPERPDLRDAAAFARFDLAFLERLKAMPQVESVGLIENVPLNEGSDDMRVRTEGMAGGGEGSIANYTFTAGDYFATMRIPVLQGRVFSNDDHGPSPGNVIVSRSMAQRLWPDRNPIGMRLQREGSTAWETVVGVVGDVMQDDLQHEPQAVIYFPLVGPDAATSRPISSPAYVVRTKRAETIGPDIRALVREIAPEAPMYRTYTMAGLVKESMLQLSFTMLTLGIASMLALILGAVGLYGTLSYVVAERTREIGVRMALGARASQVRGMVVKQGAKLIGTGVAIGLVLALIFTQAMSGLLFGVTAIDPMTFVGMSLAMAAVGLLASYLPARAASNLDPMTSLRRD